MNSYAEIRKACETNRGQFKNTRKLANNTYASFDTDSEAITIRFHGHAIVRLFADGRSQFAMCGYDTITTRSRITDYVDAARISQTNGNRHGSGGQQWLTFGGMTVPIDAWGVYELDATNCLMTNLTRSTGFGIDVPTGCNCWYCK